MNIFRITKITLIAILCLIVGWTPAISQDKKDRETNVSKDITVVDEAGDVIPFAVISSSKKRNIYTTDNNGHIVLLLPSNDVLKISAEGYTSVSINTDVAGTIILKKELAFNGEENKFNTLFGETTERRTVGARSSVKGSDLESSPTMFFYDALGGKLNGLFVSNNTLVPGFTIASIWARSSRGSIAIMVDGIQRSLDYIEPETVESVQLLKDATLKSLYGGIDATAILMVKTYRGKPFENKARVNIQTGVQVPTRLPKYLDAYDYASMYNDAAIKNGMSPVFTELDKYKTGADPILHPNIDYYDMFLNSQMDITRVNTQYSGGNEKTRYFAHLGYQTNGGLEKFTKYPNRDRVFTIRGNVDNVILNFITFSAGFNSALQNKSWPNMSTQNFFNMLSDTRPNEFPIFIPGANVGKPDQEFVYGGTAINQDNPHGALVHGGRADREYSYIQSDFSLNFDFDKWVKGFSVRPLVSFDVYNYFTSAQGETYVVWEPYQTDNGIGYYSWGQETRSLSNSRSGATTQRNFVFNVTGTYNRNFGKHDINALLTFFSRRMEPNSASQYLKRINFGGLVNYMYDNRYLAEVSLNRVGVSSFAPSKRFGIFPTFGAGWIVSEESFMKGLKWLDYMKLRASYGIFGSTSYANDLIFSTYLYRDTWETSGSYGGIEGFNNIARQQQTGNPNVGFQKSYELNFGADFQLFRNLSLSAGYYNTTIDGLLANLTDVTPGVSGKNEALMQHNFKENKTKGWEAEAMYSNSAGKLRYSIGANICYGVTDITIEADPNYPDELAGLRKIRRVGDVRGQRYIGVFSSESDIASSPQQGFGPLRPGDFKYADTNGDGTVDNADREVIANTTPSYQYGITIKLLWNGFNLDILGYGLAGFDQMLTNKYYQIYGARKYSQVLIDGLPNGNPHPVLSPEFRNNNFINSDYWVVDGSWFKLRNVELGYTLPHTTTEKFGVGALKLFLRGTNLFTISTIKDRDPENIDAGIGNFPLCRTYTGGISISF